MKTKSSVSSVFGVKGGSTAAAAKSDPSRSNSTTTSSSSTQLKSPWSSVRDLSQRELGLMKGKSSVVGGGGGSTAAAAAKAADESGPYRTEQATDGVCGYCGKAAVDDVKLKKCACKLVGYCCVECQTSHQPHHKKACKKRLAEIRDVVLFTQPDESFLGECPICFLPLPLDMMKSIINTCCSKRICDGCCHADDLRMEREGVAKRCLFCREPLPKTVDEANHVKRAKANGPLALCEMAKTRYHEGDYEGAFEYFAKAAALGHIDAHFNLSILYQLGKGVEKDMKKEMYHLEEAAIGGHPTARRSLGAYETRNGRKDRAVKHFMIAAKLGYDDALDQVKYWFQGGHVNKEDYEAALRGYQAAVDATKSEQRDAAYAFHNLSPEERRQYCHSLRRSWFFEAFMDEYLNDD